MNVPESSFSQYRPWFIVLMLESASTRQVLPKAGVDEFFMKRAAKRSMPVVGLESVQEHARIYSGLTDREGEILLLVTLIPSKAGGSTGDIMKAWRRGDAEMLARMMERESQDFPAFNERLLGARNRAWIPKIERFPCERSHLFRRRGRRSLRRKPGLALAPARKGLPDRATLTMGAAVPGTRSGDFQSPFYWPAVCKPPLLDDLICDPRRPFSQDWLQHPPDVLGQNTLAVGIGMKAVRQVELWFSADPLKQVGDSAARFFPPARQKCH